MSMPLSVLALICAIVLIASGHVSFKYYYVGPGHKRWLFVMAACFVCAQLANYIALHRLGIGMVYMAGALTHPLVILLSAKILHEQLGVRHYVSLVLIVTGILLYAY